MTNRVPPILSFEREGRPLSEWLLDLVSTDKSVREVAGETISSIWDAVPSFEMFPLISRADLHRHQSRFKQAVRRAINEFDFPRSEFVASLIALRIRSDEEIIRIAAGSSSDFNWVLNGATRVIFESLDHELLLDRVGLRKMLIRPGPSGAADEATQAISRIGSSASEFFELLLDQLDRGTCRYPWPVPSAVAAIAGNDKQKLERLMYRLHSHTGKGWEAAVWAVEEVGVNAGEMLEEFVCYLLNALKTSEWNEWHYAHLIRAVASVGRERPEVLEVVVGFATTTNPQWKQRVAHEDITYDIMLERGFAIDALKYFQSFPDRVLPVLTTALDDFKEFDTDLLYYGDRYRVCRVLAGFGPMASVAVPVISRILEEGLATSDAEFAVPTEFLDLVSAIGAGARSLEGLLLTYQQRVLETGLYDENDSENSISETIDAIRKPTV